MQFQPKCIECSKNQGRRIFNLVLENQGQKPTAEQIVVLNRELDQFVNSADPALTPACLSLIGIRLGEKHAGADDPFKEVKQNNNQLALSLYPDLKQQIADSRNPLHLACQLACCGNIIDLGIHDDFDIEQTIDKVLKEGFKRDAFHDFQQTLTMIVQEKKTPRLLYILDNAGEIVFDRLLIEEITKEYPHIAITAIVRGKPVLNDCTMIDAHEVGLDLIVEVIDNGNAKLGTVLEYASSLLSERYHQADLIISKGQANYETLCTQAEPIFFILKAKCDVIAESLHVNLWDAVMTRRLDT